MPFDALEVSLDVVRSLTRPLASLKTRDPALHRQIRAAASSVCLNLAEGTRRVGKDRRHFWRIAAGSAAELRAALRVAEAWGDLQAHSIGETEALLDRVVAILWRLTH